MVICLERGADLHMAQLIPLPLTVSCFSKIQIGVTFLVPAHPGGPGQRAVKRVCVCVCVCESLYFCNAFQRPARASFQVSKNKLDDATDFFLLIRYQSDEALPAVLTISRLQSNDAVSFVISLRVKIAFLI